MLEKFRPGSAAFGAAGGRIVGAEVVAAGDAEVLCTALAGFVAVISAHREPCCGKQEAGCNEIWMGDEQRPCGGNW